MNGKHLDLPLPTGLDIRAVRGPLTGRYLQDNGYSDPGVYGDPALLLDVDAPLVQRRSGVVFVPNLNDREFEVPDECTVLSPRSPIETLLSHLASAELVLGTSLHAIVLAEKLGTPARVVASPHEPSFKYEDYYEGTGRVGVVLAEDTCHALDLGGVEAKPVLDPDLAKRFPIDLWDGVIQ